MTRFRKPDMDRLTPTVPGLPPDVKKKIPTIDELMRRTPPLEDWRKFLPLPAPRDRDDPFGPVPIIPAHIEVDPPSRPPEYMFGPPYITQAPTHQPFPTNAFPISFLPLASRTEAGGLPGLMARSGVLDPSAPDAPPAGGLVALLQEYLRSNRERGD